MKRINFESKGKIFESSTRMVFPKISIALFDLLLLTLLNFLIKL